MRVENYFLRYAFPCAFILKQRGEINQKKYDWLFDIAVNNKYIKKEELEKIFFRAFNYIDELAKEKNKGRWDFEIIKEYFLKRHNEIIEQGRDMYKDAPETLKELSKVIEAEITDKKEDILEIRFNNKKRFVSNIFVPEAKIKDKVRVHYGFAVEIIG
ncbi:hypothetical protein ISS05_02510 [Candidatus Woesearchaeota archaeon]|nr:hypothetical protein [Candidatus Woesearchaeota archaeon]